MLSRTDSMSSLCSMVTACTELFDDHLPHIDALARAVKNFKETVKGNDNGEGYEADFSHIVRGLDIVLQHHQTLRDKVERLEQQVVREKSARVQSEKQLTKEKEKHKDTKYKLSQTQEEVKKTKKDLKKTQQKLAEADKQISKLQKEMSVLKKEYNRRLAGLEKRMTAIELKQHEKA